MSFDILDIKLQEILTELGFKPTPRQLEYLEAIINNKDVLVVASTGSGKTFGTILSLLHKILTEKTYPISMIVITPLKALNRDIYRRVLPDLCNKVGITISVRHGDTSNSDRRKQTLNPPQILITTPELFQAILPAKILGKKHLRNVHTVVIDEIHELIETKRGVQLSLALERLTKRTGRYIQRIGLSATIGSPDKVMNFLAPKNISSQIVIIPSSKKIELSMEYPTTLSNDFESLAKNLHTTPEAAARFIRLIEIIKKEQGTVLVFTNTRQQAEILGYRLNRYNEITPLEEHIKFEVHHSSLSAQSRLQTEIEVRNGNLKVIIATSSLELGIDIGTVSLVVQYMSPRRIETLIQRVGRAGHRLNQTSHGIIISENPRDLLESFVIKQLASKGDVESSNIHPIALDILFHTVIGILLDFGETTIQEIMKIINGAAGHQQLEPKDLIPLLEYGRTNRFFYIEKKEKNNIISLIPRRKSYKYYYTNLSSIPTKKSYSIIDVGSQKRVGLLDESFVTTRGEKGTIFILNGVPWEFLAIKEDKDIIQVRQVKATDATIPTWEGELIPVSQLVTEYAKTIIHSNNLEFSESSDIQKIIKTFIINQKEKNLTTKKNEILIENAGLNVVLHSFLGSKGNETLGLLLSSIIGAKQGQIITYRSDPYSIFFSLPRPLSFDPILKSVDENHIKPLLQHKLKNSDLFAWHLRQVAKRFGAISESTQNAPFMTRILISRYKDTIIGEETINEIFAENLDIGPVINFISYIKDGTLELKEILVKQFETPLSIAVTQPISQDVLKVRPSRIILNKIEKRINNTWIRLICMRLGCKFEKIQRVESLEDIIRCPDCDSRFIAVLHKDSTGIKSLLKKSIDKTKKLNSEEKKELKTAKKSADLILTFGKRAAFVLAGHGIGPTTAVRILRSPQKNTEELLELIYRYEAEFARNREYWD